MFGHSEMVLVIVVLLALVFAGVHIAIALGMTAAIGIYLMTSDIEVVRTPDEALSRLEAYFEASGRMEWFATLLPVLEGPLPDMTYREAASRLGMNEAACRQAALRFRQRYRSLLLEVASERLGITCEARLAEELRELLGNT